MRRRITALVELGLTDEDEAGRRYRVRLLNSIAWLLIIVSLLLGIPAGFVAPEQVGLHAARCSAGGLILLLSQRRLFGPAALILVAFTYLTIVVFTLEAPYETISPFTLILVALIASYLLEDTLQLSVVMIVLIGSAFLIRVLQVQDHPNLAPPYSRSLAAVLTILGILLVLQKIEQARARATLTRANEELERANRMQLEFTAMISHELRSPLTAIRGSLGLVTGGAVPADSPQAAEMMRICEANAGRLARLVDDLLDHQTIQIGALRLDRRPVRLDAILRDTLTSFTGPAKERSVELRQSSSAPIILANVDEDRIRQILHNLVTNALKFAPADSAVTLALEATARRARISVEDEGPGVPADFEPELFSRFSQPDSSDQRRPGGVGLGLSISRELARLHGGDLTYERATGGGARFVLVLPLAT